MKKINIFILIILIGTVVFGFVVIAKGASFGQSYETMSKFATGLNFLSFDDSSSTVIKNIMYLVNTLFFIFMIYAGITWFTSSGNEEKIERAKKTIIWCVVGMAVTFSSYIITDFILKRVPGSEQTPTATCPNKLEYCKTSCNLNVETNLGQVDCGSSLICCVPKQ